MSQGRTVCRTIGHWLLRRYGLAGLRRGNKVVRVILAPPVTQLRSEAVTALPIRGYGAVGLGAQAGSAQSGRSRAPRRS